MNTNPTNNADDADINSADINSAIPAEVIEETVDVKAVTAPTEAPAPAPADEPPAPTPTPAPTPAAKAAPAVSTNVASAHAVVGTGTRDDVLLSRCVFKSKATRKSLSVHHLQRRLTELGYPDAATDKDGWYGDLTRLAVSQFQTDRKLDGDGLVDAATLAAILDGDQNVTVVVD
jgi:peptidoglycan hydrolase-like protein with peptidoglycan-binding domain